MAWSCWLVAEPAGVRLAVGPQGILLGRRGDCGLILDPPGVSRVHAWVHVGPSGPEVVHCGQRPTRVNGMGVADRHPLADGDRIEIEGRTVRVEASFERRSEGGGWVLEGPDGTLCGLPEHAFVVGSGAGCDLVLDRWPDRGVCLFTPLGRVDCEALAPVTAGGRDLGEGEVVPLHAGSVLVAGGQALTLLRAPQGALATTLAEATPELPREARLDTMPRGGRLTLTYEAGPRTAYLPEKRFELANLLLKPPGQGPGSPVDDEDLLRSLWPERSRRGDPAAPQALGLLVFRLRQDLAASGAGGSWSIVRAGGTTRFCLAPLARVTVA